MKCPAAKKSWWGKRRIIQHVRRKDFTFKGVIALLTKRAQSDEYPLGIAFSSKGVRTVLMTRASQALVVVVDDWIMRQDNATSCKYNAEREPDDSSSRCNWKVLQHVWPTFRFGTELGTFLAATDAFGGPGTSDSGKHPVTGGVRDHDVRHWQVRDAPGCLQRLEVSDILGSAEAKRDFDAPVSNFRFAGIAQKKESDETVCLKDLLNRVKIQELFQRIRQSGSQIVEEAKNPEGDLPDAL
ncbi:unnamed protein product [Symbiodinium necroappetens]|uniref:Uncharacterized protein n=1 Tax=Symbiodinium necroappetens TaxID=1628268 RepID=A0A813B0Z8_9DINO|nr:unnamed protein product [Symbiodinium necroappetens]